MEPKDSTQNDKKKRRLLYLFTIMAVLFIMTVIVMAFNVKRSKEEHPQSGGIGYDVNQTNEPISSNASSDKQLPAFPSVTMPGCTKINASSDSAIVKNVSLFNPEDNEGWYDLAFTISVDVNGNGEYTTVYESEKVAPGYRITEFEMDKILEAGTYNARIDIIPYYIYDNNMALNRGAINVPMIVE